jgi:hypothetical protein
MYHAIWYTCHLIYSFDSIYLHDLAECTLAEILWSHQPPGHIKAAYVLAIYMLVKSI